MKAVGIIKYVFSFLGIGMLAGALFLYQGTRSFLAEAARTEGTVVDFLQTYSKHGVTCAPVVHFVNRNNETIVFVSSIATNPPGYAKGEKVEVLYFPAKPQEARINSFFSLWGGSVIPGVMGAIFFLIGAGVTLVPMLKKRQGEYLKEQGRAIETDFKSVRVNGAVFVNGRNPFRVLTQWKDPASSQVRVFESNDIWYDPTNHINSQRIRVFIDKNNPKKYYVDLSFLPRMEDPNF